MKYERIIEKLSDPKKFNIFYFEEIDSTNTFLYQKARGNLPDWSVAVAEKQVAGKGRFSRRWESPPHVGLWFSFLLHPQLRPDQLNLINILVAYTIATTLEEEIFRRNQLPVNLWLKWPNDILYHQKKLCGILLEGNFLQQRINYVVVGVGLNVNQKKKDFPPSLRSLATSLRMITNHEWDREILLATLLDAIRTNYFYFLPSRATELVSLYRKKVQFLGKEIKVMLQDKEIQGIFKDITPEGYLILKVNDREEVITTGDVFKVQPIQQVIL